MATRNYISIETMNAYMVEILSEKAWAYMWEVSPKDRSGISIFRLMLRPNVIERLEFNHHLGSAQRIASSNSLTYPPSEYASSYSIEIKLLSSHTLVKNGRKLGCNKKLRFAYSKYLEKMFKSVILELDNPQVLGLKHLDHSLFGIRYERLKKWKKAGIA